MRSYPVISLAALACAASLLLSCGGSNSNAPGPVDVYVAGVSGDGAAYWKNGALVTLPGINGIAYSVAVSGSDIYVGGAAQNSQGHGVATIWKNGTPTTLSSGYSQVTALAVADGNVYAVGWDQSSPNQDAILWTNGTPAPLLDGMLPFMNSPNSTFASSVYISGSDVYVAGATAKYFQISPGNYWTANVATYWKNGAAVDLTQVSNECPNVLTESIALIGTDIYVAGTIEPIHNAAAVAVYWKNGTQVKLSSKPSNTTSLAASGSTVYIAGNNGDDSGYWSTGAGGPFTPAGSNLPEQIAVNRTDIYLTSNYISSNGYSAMLTKNGVSIPLPSGPGQSAAYGIALVPQQ